MQFEQLLQSQCRMQQDLYQPFCAIQQTPNHASMYICRHTCKFLCGSTEIRLDDHSTDLDSAHSAPKSTDKEKNAHGSIIQLQVKMFGLFEIHNYKCMVTKQLLAFQNRFCNSNPPINVCAGSSASVIFVHLSQLWLKTSENVGLSARTH